MVIEKIKSNEVIATSAKKEEVDLNKLGISPLKSVSKWACGLRHCAHTFSCETHGEYLA